MDFENCRGDLEMYLKRFAGRGDEGDDDILFWVSLHSLVALALASGHKGIEVLFCLLEVTGYVAGVSEPDEVDAALMIDMSRRQNRYIAKKFGPIADGM